MNQTRHRWWVLAGLLVVVTFLAWVFFRWRSQADRLIAKLEAQGERFTLEDLGLENGVPPDADWAVFEQTGPRFGELRKAEVAPEEGWKFEESRANPPQVSWQQPFLYSPRHAVLDWDRATELADQIQPELQALHEAVREGAPQPGWDPFVAMPNFVAMRTSAQGLHELVMVELHRGETAQAYTNLLSLVRLCRGRRAGSTLVEHMIHVAVTGLTIDALWHALQAPGWTDDQLATLQAELDRVDLPTPLVGNFELERIGRLWGIAESQKGLDRLTKLAGQAGLPVGQSVGWRQRLHHLHWDVVRSPGVRVEVIEQMQQQIERARLMAQGQPLEMLPALPPAAAPSAFQSWLDRWADPGGSPVSILTWYSGSPNFDRVFPTVARVEAKRRLALTALALERFRRAGNELPGALEELVPGYLETLPEDPFDGRPMHYEPKPEGRFMLSFLTVEGESRVYGDEPLLWPVAEAPLPVPSRVRPEPQNDVVLELVVFDAVPLFDALRNLARQAEMNYMIDPRVRGREYPPVSLRVTNVTARAVFEELLRQNQLRLYQDPKSRIYRISW